MAFGDAAIFEVDLRVNAETPHDAGDGVPVHFDEFARRGLLGGSGIGHDGRHNLVLLFG